MRPLFLQRVEGRHPLQRVLFCESSLSVGGLVLACRACQPASLADAGLGWAPLTGGEASAVYYRSLRRWVCTAVLWYHMVAPSRRSAARIRRTGQQVVCLHVSTSCWPLTAPHPSRHTHRSLQAAPASPVKSINCDLMRRSVASN